MPAPAPRRTRNSALLLLSAAWCAACKGKGVAPAPRQHPRRAGGMDSRRAIPCASRRPPPHRRSAYSSWIPSEQPTAPPAGSTVHGEWISRLLQTPGFAAARPAARAVIHPRFLSPWACSYCLDRLEPARARRPSAPSTGVLGAPALGAPHCPHLLRPAAPSWHQAPAVHARAGPRITRSYARSHARTGPSAIHAPVVP